MSRVVRRRFLLCVGAVTLLLAGWPPAAIAAGTLDVPGSFATIQAAIDAAAPGDTVVVAPGTYHESIDFEGKAITVESGQGPGSTIIDASGLGRSVVTFHSGEGRGSVLQGFTIEHGSPSVGVGGGGVAINGASPTIAGNVVKDNVTCGNGSGIDSEFASPLITGNVITGNSDTPGPGCTGNFGGGIAIGGAGSTQVIGNTVTNNGNFWAGAIGMDAAGTPTIADNIISGNSSQAEGGAIWSVNQSDAVIVQNLFTNNTSPSEGGGIFFEEPSVAQGATLVNNSFAGNSASDGAAIYLEGYDNNTRLFNNIFQSPSSVNAVECDTSLQPDRPVLDHDDAFSAGGGQGFAGGCAGAAGAGGNISADPLFATGFHLQAGSPAIDAGNDAAPDLPAADLSGNPRIVGTAVDLGVYEGPAPAPPVATFSPASVAFGTLAGSTTAATAPVTLSNTGGSSLGIASDVVLPGGSLFGIASDGCAGRSLAPGASCVILVGFLPDQPGSFTGSLQVTDDLGTQTVTLSGTVLTGQVAASPGAVSFGTVRVGRQSKAQTVTISDDGNETLHIGSLSLRGADPADFVVVSSGCANATLAPGATCTLSLAFRPAAAGSRTADLVVASDAPAPFDLPLKGTGT